MESDSAYRQGTVLGLTIAEMFILLIFLLLIAFLGFAYQEQKKGEELSSFLHKYYPPEIEPLTPEVPDPIELVKELIEENKELKAEKEELQRERETLKKQTEELANLRKKNKDLQAEKEELQKEQETLKKQTEAAKREAMQARKELQKGQNNLAADTSIVAGMPAKKESQKGQNPPCWYDAEKGGTRGHYLFNIEIHDDHMVVQRLEYPPGRYAEEARRLPLRPHLDSIPYGEPLTNEELDQYMRPIHDLGKNKEVRSYSCIFYVKVCSKISKSIKALVRWRKAHEVVLEGLFGTYLGVENEAWCSEAP